MNYNTTDTNEQTGYTDDTRVLRYLLHTIKGISPVSGGEMGIELERDYAVASDSFDEL